MGVLPRSPVVSQPACITGGGMSFLSKAKDIQDSPGSGSAQSPARILSRSIMTENHEHHPVGHTLGKAHFMRRNDHSHPFLGEVDHDVRNLFYHFGDKSGSGFIKNATNTLKLNIVDKTRKIIYMKYIFSP
jgi:hypothetical protein